MRSLWEFVIDAPLIIKAVTGVLLLLSALFIAIFLTRAMRSLAVLTNLKKLKAISGPKEQALESSFSINRTFSHLWREYKDTLHQQQEYEPNGRRRADVLRSTVPASMVFTNDVIVDTPLATEFFRHLPGIFTGVGIIGTFWGIIEGLQAFRISDNPTWFAQPRRTDAPRLVRFYRLGDGHPPSDDRDFRWRGPSSRSCTGRSKRSPPVSTVSSIRARARVSRPARESVRGPPPEPAIEGALVTDLERILTTLTERQIEAQSAGTGLGRQLADGVAVSLQKPLEDLAEGVGETPKGTRRQSHSF